MDRAPEVALVVDDGLANQRRRAPTSEFSAASSRERLLRIRTVRLE
jgi:hypothetical protein